MPQPHLPKNGWGRIDRLKHRADNETRTIPIPPELVRLLRAHIRRYGTTPDGRIFQTARGGVLQDSGYNEVWTETRKQALSPAQQRSRSAAARMT
jgi:integrase